MSSGCVYPHSLCQNLTEQSKVARLSARDVQYDISCDQVYIPGIDLNTALFNKVGYIQPAITEIKNYLDLGLRRLELDVYWDGSTRQWYLCPDPWSMNVTQLSFGPSEPTSSSMYKLNYPGICDTNLSVASLLDGVADFMSLSDTNVAANLIHLHLRPKKWSAANNLTSNAIMQLSGISSLNSTLQNEFSPRIFTPSELSALRSGKSPQVTTEGTGYQVKSMGWPSLRDLILNYEKRLLVSYPPANDALIGNSGDILDIAFAIPSGQDSLQGTDYELSQKPFRSALASTPDQFRYIWQMGASPVINETMTSDQLVSTMDTSYDWFWAPNEPVLYSYDERVAMTVSNTYEACALLEQNGLYVADCSEAHYSLCRDNHNNTRFAISQSLDKFYDQSCPDGYSFTLPRTPLESRTVRDTVLGSDTVWVDMNSLFYPNCWVTGGVLQVCPYNVIQGTRNGVASITVAATAAACMLLVIVLFELDRLRSPVRRNLPRPKAPKDYEGVPI